jgi:hypothetical protein
MMKVSDSGLQNTNNSGVRRGSWLCSKVSDQVRSGVADKGHTFNHDWIDFWGKNYRKAVHGSHEIRFNQITQVEV